MDWMEILTQLFEMVIIPLLGIGTIYLINLIKVKIQELKAKKDNDLLHKYLDLLEDTIIQCVLATTQTYVDTLKQQGKFDAEAQKVAFEKTYTNVMNILADEAKEYLENALGDLEAYIYNRIEAGVKVTK